MRGSFNIIIKLGYYFAIHQFKLVFILFDIFFFFIEQGEENTTPAPKKLKKGMYLQNIVLATHLSLLYAFNSENYWSQKIYIFKWIRVMLFVFVSDVKANKKPNKGNKKTPEDKIKKTL